MSNLATYRLGDIATFVNGRAYSMPEMLLDGKYRIVRVGNFTGKDEWYYSDMELDADKYCESGDLLYKWACTFGPEIWTEEKAIYHYHIWKVVPNEKYVDKEYLYYLLSFMTSKWMKAAHGSTMVHITKEIMENNIVTIPADINEQRLVAAQLKIIDAKIDNNNAICADLEGMAKLLYDYWFVQFDFPDESGKPYKSSGGKMVWNEALKREIPEGWEVVSLETQFSITMGTSPEGKSINENEEGVPFYQGKTDFGFRFPAVRTYTTTPIRYAYRGDTLLSVRAPVGALNRAIETCCIGRGVASIHADEFPSYAYYTSLSLRPRFEKYNGDGTTFGCIGRDDLFAIPAVKPERSLIEKFEKITRQIDAKIENAEMENTELASLRDFLLPMLMNGQVKVKGA